MADVTVAAVTHDDAMVCLSIADKILDVARHAVSQKHELASTRPLTLAAGD